jgi:hypothetical protein
MKRSGMFNVVWFVLAFVSQELVLDVANFNYNLFRDPFDVAKFAIKFGTLVGFVIAYRWLLGLVWKSRSEN